MKSLDLYSDEFHGAVKPRIEPETGVPWCSDACPSHDGKRCRMTGFRPSSICEPYVQYMAYKIDNLESNDD